MVLWNLDLIEHIAHDGSLEISSAKITSTFSHIRLDPQASKLVVSQIIIDEVPVTGSEGAGVSAQCSVTASHLATVYIF